MKVWREIDVPTDLPDLGPWPIEDNLGFKLALGQLHYSQRTRNNKGSHLQYNTFRGSRTAMSHVMESRVYCLEIQKERHKPLLYWSKRS